MVRIRLRRLGAKGKPCYRIVIADRRAARDGAFIEQVGTYDPIQDPPAVTLNEESALRWLRNGAQPTAAVKHILDKAGVLAKVK